MQMFQDGGSERLQALNVVADETNTSETLIIAIQ